MRGFEAGGQIAGVYPLAGLDRYHVSSAAAGVGAAWTTGPLRLELSYRYAALPGVQNISYRLSLHQTVLTSGYAFLRRPDWGLEALTGLGGVFAERTYGTGRENGNTGLAELGIGIYQYSGKSRLSAGIVPAFFLEKGASGTPALAVTPLLSLRAGVSYVF